MVDSRNLLQVSHTCQHNSDTSCMMRTRNMALSSLLNHKSPPPRRKNLRKNPCNRQSNIHCLRHHSTCNRSNNANYPNIQHRHECARTFAPEMISHISTQRLSDRDIQPSQLASVSTFGTHIDRLNLAMKRKSLWNSSLVRRISRHLLCCT